MKSKTVFPGGWVKTTLLSKRFVPVACALRDNSAREREASGLARALRVAPPGGVTGRGPPARENTLRSAQLPQWLGSWDALSPRWLWAASVAGRLVLPRNHSLRLRCLSVEENGITRPQR